MNSFHERIESQGVLETTPQIDPGIESEKARNGFRIGALKQNRNYRKRSAGALFGRLACNRELHLASLNGAKTVLADEHGCTAYLMQGRFEFVEPRLAGSQ